jgi:hypothetical protein
MDRQLNLLLEEEGANAEQLDVLTGYLRQELLQLDVDDVLRRSVGQAPPGSRAIDVDTLGGLVVALGQSATGLKDVIAAIRWWLSRGDAGRRTVTIEVDGDKLQLSHVSAAEQDRLIDMFVDRHSIGKGGGERPA